MATATKAASNGTSTLSVPTPNIRRVTFHVTGTSPLICNRWSEKAKKQMLDKQMKKAKKGREAKDPEQDYEQSLYRSPDGGYGFPSVAFKAAAVRAGTYADMKMTYLRGAFHVLGELVPIIGEPRPREDMVRVQMTTDIRYRGEFPDWAAEVPVDLNETALSIEQLANLFTVAGFAVGVGEWRPEKNGQNGRFALDRVEVA